MAGQTSNEPKQLRSSTKGLAESKAPNRLQWKKEPRVILFTKKCKKGTADP